MVWMLAGENPQKVLDTALHAIATAPAWRPVLDQLPVPIYTTDAEGSVTYWNRACVELAGRRPQLGKDKWCVTWKIYTTTGEHLPHDQCPMAEAIREQRIVRDVVAIAARPDGTRRAFRPYPTPLFDEDGELTGAINMLVDVTDEQSFALAEQAGRCRRLASSMYNRETSTVLESMADQYDRTVAELCAQRAR